MFKWLGLILSILVIIFSSWLGIHILAVFGIFVALAYPFCWLIVPDRIPCLLCRAQKEGTKCPFCRSQIIKSEGVFPRNLMSANLNALLIFVFSIISIGAVFLESQALFYFGVVQAPKTAFFDIPPKGEYMIGAIFPMQVEVNNIKNSINSVQADIGFDSSKIQVVKISTQGSFANIFIQKEIDNENGYVRISGGLPNPGWYGTHGVFATVYFKAMVPGLTTVSYLPSSLVLADDGHGTNILKSLPSVSYLILPQKISSETQKQQQNLLSLNTSSVNSQNQLDFSNITNVLGASTKNIKPVESKFNAVKFLLNILGEIDAFILGFISKILSIIGI